MSAGRLHLPKNLDARESGVASVQRRGDIVREDLREALHLVRQTLHQVNKAYEAVIAGHFPSDVDNTGSAPEVTGTEDAPFAPGDGVDDILKIKVTKNGVAGSSQTFDLAATDTTAALVAAKINATAEDFFAIADGDAVKLYMAPAYTGSDNVLEIEAVANDAYTVLGLTADTYPGVSGARDTFRLGLQSAKEDLAAAWLSLKSAWDQHE